MMLQEQLRDKDYSFDEPIVPGLKLGSDWKMGRRKHQRSRQGSEIDDTTSNLKPTEIDESSMKFPMPGLVKKMHRSEVSSPPSSIAGTRIS